jgi:hypothetical protein
MRQATMQNDSADNGVSNNGLYYNIFTPVVDLWQPTYAVFTPAPLDTDIEVQLNPVTASTPTPLSKQAEAMVGALLGLAVQTTK